MGIALGTKQPLTSPCTTNHAFALASAVVKSSIRSCRLIFGLVMITSGAFSIPLAVGSNPDGRRRENLGLEGSNPSSFILCIQPPSCLPATETKSVYKRAVVIWGIYTGWMLELKLSVSNLIDANTEPPSQPKVKPNPLPRQFELTNYSSFQSHSNTCREAEEPTIRPCTSP